MWRARWGFWVISPITPTSALSHQLTRHKCGLPHGKNKVCFAFILIHLSLGGSCLLNECKKLVLFQTVSHMRRVSHCPSPAPARTLSRTSPSPGPSRHSAIPQSSWGTTAKPDTCSTSGRVRLNWTRKRSSWATGRSCCTSQTSRSTRGRTPAPSPACRADTSSRPTSTSLPRQWVSTLVRKTWNMKMTNHSTNLLTTGSDEHGTKRSRWCTAASVAFFLCTVMMAVPQCVKQRGTWKSLRGFKKNTKCKM